MNNEVLAGTAATAETASEKTSYSWDEVRAELDLDEIEVARQRASLEAEVRAYKLAEIRKHLDVTQQAIANALGVSQSRISQIERQELDDTVLSTLAAYVEALGGHVSVIADFGTEQVLLSRIPGRVSAKASGGVDVQPDQAAWAKARYEAGESIRNIAFEAGRSYGFIHRILQEAGVTLRGRGSSRAASARSARVAGKGRGANRPVG
jgi:transcriptional regulator with XRE-family HTH domain